jgi:hypothetical protein
MASVDLKLFIESRLRSLQPNIDLDAGSPAQLQVVGPIIDYLGTDPFETDIDAFILDRFAQEFPDIYASDPSIVRDTFIKPLILLLTPFKRETQGIKRDQSLKDPTLLSDEAADALIANVFEQRDTGGKAIGVVRNYYPNPVTTQVEITTRYFTSSGLSFYPVSPVAISAEEMSFQRQGGLYYFDLTVQASQEGSEFNIAENEISGVEGLTGPSKVSNPRKFQSGSPKVDTPTFIAQAEQALTERSLVTRRGATARVNKVFQGDVRAVQVVGAGDPEMRRDILVADSKGQAWLTGTVSLYQNIAYVRCKTIDGDITDAPVPGDTLYVYLDKYSYSGVWAGLSQNLRPVRFKVEQVLAQSTADASPYQVSYVVRYSGTTPVGVTIPNPAILSGGFIKKSQISISSLPSVGKVATIAVQSEAVHVYGHSDIYVRPVLQPVSKAVFDGVFDFQSYVERTTLQTTSASNQIDDLSFNFSTNGVTTDDLVVIESGDDAGTYGIRHVGTTSLNLNVNLVRTATNLNYRIVRRVRVDPFDPKILKFPFAGIAANDLSTTIGSPNVVLDTNDLVVFGIHANDTLRILSGSDLGDYTIVSLADGRHFTLDRPLTSSNSQVPYQVFTSLEKVQRPLVRIRQLLILDSAKQTTGITIPPAEPVAVVPVCDATGAQVLARSSQKSAFVLPALTDPLGADPWVVAPNVASSPGGRYSLGLDAFTGFYKAMSDASGAQQEFNFPADANQSCSYIMLTPEQIDLGNTVNAPPLLPTPGMALTIKSGPNSGSYLIKSVSKFNYVFNNSSQSLKSLYFIKIYGTFPVDVFRNLIHFLDVAYTAGCAGALVPKVNQATAITFPDFFQNIYNNLGASLDAALTFYGSASPGPSVLQSMIVGLAQTDYEIGNTAKVSMRTYFREPTLFEQRTANNPAVTLFNLTTSTGSNVQFRPDPSLFTKQQIVPARLDRDLAPTEYYRDIDVSGSSFTPVFTDTSKPSVLNAGVMVGDHLEVHTEVFLKSGGTKLNPVAVSTVAGSNALTLPTNSGATFVPNMVGNLLYIDQGQDSGAYVVTGYVGPQQILVDRSLSKTTPSIIAYNNLDASYGVTAGVNKVNSPGFTFTTAHLNKYLTLYGVNYDYMGSYKIKTILDVHTVEVDRTSVAGIGDFPAYPAEVGGSFVITDAPVSALTAAGHGTMMHGLQAIRMYHGIPIDSPISAVLYTSPTLSQMTVTAGIINGYRQPYRIYRPDVRRVTPSEMANNMDGPFYYFDTPCVSLSPQSSANVSENKYLTLIPGTYVSHGYKHSVDDNTLTYSMRETGFLDLPNKVLPVGAADSPSNYLLLVGTPVQVTYEQSDVGRLLQEFLDSALDRVTAANMLARHFLPSYLSYDATYSGGSAPSVIAKDIISYLDTLPVEGSADVSQIEKLIDQRGGNPDTPTKLMALIFDWDRRAWLEMSQNQLGGTTTDVPYNGTPRVSYFTPGQDVSGQSPLPVGERINLTRR